MMDIFEQAYFNILFEENFSNESWMKYGSYRGIDFYIRRDRHLQRRLLERYENKVNVSNIIDILKSFIKQESKDGFPILKGRAEINSEIPFTIYAELSKVYISGRFKKIKDMWCCYIATVLPNKDTHHSSNDYFKSVRI